MPRSQYFDFAQNIADSTSTRGKWVPNMSSRQSSTTDRGSDWSWPNAEEMQHLMYKGRSNRCRSKQLRIDPNWNCIWHGRREAHESSLNYSICTANYCNPECILRMVIFEFHKNFKKNNILPRLILLMWPPSINLIKSLFLHWLFLRITATRKIKQPAKMYRVTASRNRD
jgi:hypothetical protein